MRERSLLACFAVTLAAAAFGAGVADAGARADDLERLGKPALEKEKLREEIRALRKSRTEAWWERPEAIPVAAALVAFLSAAGAFVNQTREYGRQKDRDREAARARDDALAHQKDVDRKAAAARDEAFTHQQEEDRAQRAAERQRRYDELFATTSANLASENEALRLAAAASIESAFLPNVASREAGERDAYRAQVFTLLVGVLALPNRRPSDRVLVGALTKALRSQLPILQPHEIEPAPGELGLDEVYLATANLSGLDLRGVTFNDADLTGANLSGSILTQCQFRSASLGATSGRGCKAGKAIFMDADLENADFSETRMRGAHFDGAWLVSTQLRRADLTNARFTNTNLQSAHFDGARLSGSTFDGADLADAWFLGALGEGPNGTLEDAMLKSFLRAERWQSAHWDVAVLDRLKALA